MSSGGRREGRKRRGRCHAAAAGATAAPLAPAGRERASMRRPAWRPARRSSSIAAGGEQQTGAVAGEAAWPTERRAGGQRLRSTRTAPNGHTGCQRSPGEDLLNAGRFTRDRFCTGWTIEQRRPSTQPLSCWEGCPIPSERRFGRGAKVGWRPRLGRALPAETLRRPAGRFASVAGQHASADAVPAAPRQVGCVTSCVVRSSSSSTPRARVRVSHAASVSRPNPPGSRPRAPV